MGDEIEPPTRTISLENRKRRRRRKDQQQILAEEEGFVLKYGADQVIQLFVPVSSCMLIVVLTISNVTFYTTKDIYLPYTPFHETSSDTFTKTWNAIANSLIMVTFFAVMTVVLITLYKYRFYKVLYAWLMVSILAFLFVFAYIFFEEVLRAYNIPMDIITLFLFNWNFGVVGMVVIYWRGPLIIQQTYLIFIAALMALVFIKYLPEWSTWSILFGISIWDLFAVLTPVGPLRILVEIVQERNEPFLPGLLYSAMAYSSIIVTEQDEREAEPAESSFTPPTDRATFVVAARDSDQGESSQQSENGDNTQSSNPRLEGSTAERRSVSESERREESGQRRRKVARRKQQQRNTDSGMKLGLGDFIFYSVLVGKASSYGDWNTTLACFVAILIGLCSTLLLLTSSRKALPALPISIFFGLVFYFFTRGIVKPFADLLASEQIFI